MRNNRFTSDIFDLIEVVIDFDNKLYKRVINRLIALVREIEFNSRNRIESKVLIIRFLKLKLTIRFDFKS